MSYPNAQQALQSYSQADVHGGAAYASPHRVIQMLLGNVLDKVALARGNMQRGNVAAKCEHISRAIAVVEGLRLCLDTNAGGDIARNLEDLYDYIERRLLHANMKNDLTALSEVASLVGEIKGGWDAIADQVGNPPMSARPVPSANVPVVG